MDLSPEGIAAQARELVRNMVAKAVGEEMPADWYDYPNPSADVAEVRRLADTIAAALGAVRDAATAAERERHAALVEAAKEAEAWLRHISDTDLLPSDVANQARADLLRNALAALRGDDHE